MSILIKDMDMPDKCWDCELFDELSIHFTGITALNTDIGWCRGCKKEILNMDYKEDKPFWCPLVEILTQQWIPCSERLPEIGQAVLRTIKKIGWNGEEYRMVDIGCYDTNDGSIIAWMPLPKAWKGE